jgi:tetratricopeptide (TPR) repeat protein
MRGAIAWSHDLLTPEEQALFRHLSVFVGGFDLDAVEAVAAAGEGPLIGVFDGTGSLVDMSLLRPEAELDGGPDAGTPRYGILETIREFAAERLEASGEADEVRARHAAYFLELAERSAPPWSWGQFAPGALDRFEREHGNLRAAFAWFHARGDAAAGLRLAAAVHEFREVRGHRREGRDALERALALPGDAPAALRAEALARLGWTAVMLGDHGAATAAGDRALVSFRGLGDAVGTAQALAVLGLVAMNVGDLDRSERLYEEAREVERAGGDPRRGARFLNELGLIAELRGDLDRATELFDEFVRLAREAGHDHDVATGLNNLAVVAQERGDLHRAAALRQEALGLWRALRDPGGLVWSVWDGASLAGAAGRAELAARLLGAAEALRERAGTPLKGIDQAEYAGDLAAARRGLSEAAFAAAWAAGRALPLEDALAEAEAVFAAVAAGAIREGPD